MCCTICTSFAHSHSKSHSIDHTSDSFDHRSRIPHTQNQVSHCRLCKTSSLHQSSNLGRIPNTLRSPLTEEPNQIFLRKCNFYGNHLCFCRRYSSESARYTFGISESQYPRSHCIHTLLLLLYHTSSHYYCIHMCPPLVLQS